MITLIVRRGSLMIVLAIGNVKRVVLHEDVIVTAGITHALLARA